MQTLRQLYKIGRGPSSSHSIGPDLASKRFLTLYPDADRFAVTLYGSLALTGRGHMTDRVIKEAFDPIPVEITFDTETVCEKYQNTLDFFAYNGGRLLGTKRAYSIGGGCVLWEGEDPDPVDEVYPHNSYAEISAYCRENNIRIWQYVERFEGKEIWDYLYTILCTMRESVSKGLSAEGELAVCTPSARPICSSTSGTSTNRRRPARIGSSAPTPSRSARRTRRPGRS